MDKGIKITCLVDNSVQARSTLWGEHGLSFLIESHGSHLLLDTGASGAVLEHNLQEINLPPGTITALVLSHAHYDHTGGLAAFLEQQPGLPLYAHSDLFRERYSRRQDQAKSVGLSLTEANLRSRTDLRLSSCTPGGFAGCLDHRPNHRAIGAGRAQPAPRCPRWGGLGAGSLPR